MSPAEVQTLAVKKSTAAKTSVWDRINYRQVVFVPCSGAGGKP